MKDSDTRQQFVLLRARGMSYAKIAEELGVSRQTLIRWSKDLSHEIMNHRAIEEEALREQHRISRRHRIAAMGTVMRKMLEQLEKRDLSDLGTSQLINLMGKCLAEIRSEDEPVVFGENYNPLESFDMTEARKWEG